MKAMTIDWLHNTLSLQSSSRVHHEQGDQGLPSPHTRGHGDNAKTRYTLIK
jgi:hypothetical protein